jgi:hypothetical protein
VKIIKMLERFGELDTATIYGLLNDTKSDFGLRHGCTTASLNNILGKEPVFLKMRCHADDNAPRCMGASGSDYKISSWALNQTLLEIHPELASENTNSYQLLRNVGMKS